MSTTPMYNGEATLKKATKCNKLYFLGSDVVAYLTDLMHDKNPEVQRVCDATLDIISCHDDLWRERVRSEKFRFHNAHFSDQTQFLQKIIMTQNDVDGCITNSLNFWIVFKG